jgi:hypothetical protein
MVESCTVKWLYCNGSSKTIIMRYYKAMQPENWEKYRIERQFLKFGWDKRSVLHCLYQRVWELPKTTYEISERFLILCQLLLLLLFVTMTNNYCTKFINILMSLNPTRVSVPGGPSSGVTVVELASLLSLHVVMVSSGTLHFVITP